MDQTELEFYQMENHILRNYCSRFPKMLDQEYPKHTSQRHTKIIQFTDQVSMRKTKTDQKIFLQQKIQRRNHSQVGRRGEIAVQVLLLLSRFSRVRLCATPQTAAPPAPPSLGFSRQEPWSGLPFPSPMRESESEAAQSCLTLSDPMDRSPPGSSVHGFSRRESWSGAPSPSPAVQVRDPQVED